MKRVSFQYALSGDHAVQFVSRDGGDWYPPVKPVGKTQFESELISLGYRFEGTGFTKDGEFCHHWLLPENDLEALQYALANHDWYYQMSDSHNVWQQGEAQHQHIMSLVKKLGEQGQKLYDRYAKRNLS